MVKHLIGEFTSRDEIKVRRIADGRWTNKKAARCNASQWDKGLTPDNIYHGVLAEFVANKVLKPKPNETFLYSKIPDDGWDLKYMNEKIDVKASMNDLLIRIDGQAEKARDQDVYYLLLRPSHWFRIFEFAGFISARKACVRENKRDALKGNHKNYVIPVSRLEPIIKSPHGKHFWLSERKFVELKNEEEKMRIAFIEEKNMELQDRKSIYPIFLR